jgi:hypothetical protein
MIRQEAAPPPKPNGFDPQALFGGVHWHQQWEVYEGVFAPGANPVRDLTAFADVPQGLSGKRCWISEPGTVASALNASAEARPAFLVWVRMTR